MTICSEGVAGYTMTTDLWSSSPKFHANNQLYKINEDTTKQEWNMMEDSILSAVFMEATNVPLKVCKGASKNTLFVTGTGLTSSLLWLMMKKLW